MNLKKTLAIIAILSISIAGFAQEEIKEQKQLQTKTQLKEQTGEQVQTKAQVQEQKKTQTKEQLQTEAKVKEQNKAPLKLNGASVQCSAASFFISPLNF